MLRGYLPDCMTDYTAGPQAHSSSFMVSSWGYRLLLGVIVLQAFILRLWGIGWGLPYADHYHDEQTVARVVLGMIERGDWNPRFFDYPSLYFYVLRLVFDAHWRYG